METEESMGDKPPSHFSSAVALSLKNSSLSLPSSPSSPSRCQDSDSRAEPVRIPRPFSYWTEKALGIPEIIQLIQEQLDRPSLLISLRVARLWCRAGHHLPWRTVDWDNTFEGSYKEQTMCQNVHRVRVLRCMFHSQDGTVSNVGSSAFLRSIILGDWFEPACRSIRSSEDTSVQPGVESSTVTPSKQYGMLAAYSSLSTAMPAARTTGLWKLHLKGHFDLQTSSLIDVKPGSSNLYIPFNIPTLTHLEICPSINSTVDIHLILDSAVRLQHLFIQSHGSFVDSINDEQLSSNDSSTATGLRKERRIHQSLLTLKIQHLKMKREELEGIAARCPNLIELQSLCNPGNLWRERPPIQQQQQHVGANVSSTGPQEGPSQENQESKKSLVRTLATSCPNIQRFHIGLQQGGFPLQSIRETMTSFPKLETLGIPAWDCSKVTMETLKAAQDNPRSLATSGAFLTKLCIMNVCSSEKISQAIHDYLSWTPHLKEFYAYNTTLYVEQIQMQTQTQTATLQKRDHAVPHSLAQGTSPIVSNNGLEGFFVNQDGTRHSHGISHSRLQHQHIPETGSSLIPDAAAAIADDNHAIYLSHPAFITVSQQQRPRQWACTQLEKLVVRFARLPWRNLSEPPKSSKDTFAFLIPLQNLKYLCIKEGLMLETGREYDALRQMKGLEEVVFTTCYPIPIKPRDMASWMTTGAEKGPGMVTEEKDKDKGKEVRALKRVIVRRQKANAVLDKEMEEWFREHRPDVRFAYETTDGCEEEYSFD